MATSGHSGVPGVRWDPRHPTSPAYPDARDAVEDVWGRSHHLFATFGYSKYPEQDGQVLAFNDVASALEWFKSVEPGYEFVAVFDLSSFDFWPYPVVFLPPG